MSQGAFERTFYEMSADNGGFVVPCRVQPETIAAEFASVDNEPPEGPADFPASATVSQGKRTAGVNMRTVTIAWTGAPPTNYQATGRITIPVLQPSTFANWTVGSTGTYLATAAEIVGRSPETVK